ncbi:FIP1[V]-like protein isoform X2 [Macadamia integrifolia]|uniref:FIP1[V]-like protein isoform X2 n=1 Tax=Macadamia integrifolia TaxID=60698 RepID=UPI001C5000ED|nr:FIP1[V]-like protein isoform X2 [Macadamia integrifolia]
MEDDDEFGDLYTDVLLPFSSSAPTPPPVFSSSVSGFSAKPSSDPNNHGGDEEFLFGAPNSSSSVLTYNVKKEERDQIREESNYGATNWNDIKRVDKLEEKEEEEHDKEAARASDTQLSNSSKTEVPIDLDNGAVELQQSEDARVSETLETFEKSGINEAQGEEGGNKDRILIDDGGVFQEEEAGDKVVIDVGVDDMDSEPIIPGLSGGSFIPGVFDDPGNGGSAKAAARMEDRDGARDDWDSDSEDDLQIVLNDNTGPLGMDRKEGMGSDDEDEDGEDLIIVADGDQHHPPMEEQEWGDDSAQAPDGERKEGGDTVKANGAMVNAVGARIGYSNHGYHPHHSQFKYVRPGAAVMPGGSFVGPGGVSGQVRPPITMGPVAGRGRGDWRPSGVKAAPTMQKSFHSGFGPSWANNSVGRGYGGGMEFTLPSHKTVFDIDIDSFEEKPWRHPGVDTADFFNFGLDEEKWKDYCRQLEQLRLEATMQSKIRVYESGRSEQDYDPDLPPELAAAAGIHDASAENAHPGKTDGAQSDLLGQGRGAARVRAPIPTGRAIQVEGGYGERLPSIDTRPPRIRDSDAIIEIVLQDSNDDDPITDHGNLEQQENDSRGDYRNGGGDEVENMGQTESGYFGDRLPQTYNGRKKEVVGRRTSFMGPVHNNIHEGDGILPFPPEAPMQYHPGSKGRSHSYPGGMYGTPHEERGPPDAARDRYHPGISEHGHDLVTSPRERVNRFDDSQEKSGESSDRKQTPESSPTSEKAGKEPSLEPKDAVPHDLVLADRSTEAEGEEMAANSVVPSDGIEDGSLQNSVEKQKLSSHVEQPVVQDIGDGDDLRVTCSSDNSKARSGNSRGYQKRREDGEEEVLQDGRSRRMIEVKRPRNDEEHSFRRGDDYGRDVKHEIDHNRMAAKGREDLYYSYPRRDWDPSSAHYSRMKAEGFERPKERDKSTVAWQRRDEETHARRGKDEETRKNEYVEEMGSRHRIKVRESERSDKDEHLHSRKRLDNGDWRGRTDKDVGPRQRERDDSLISRRENGDDTLSKRRKDEELQRREQAEKEETLHGYRAREQTSRRKRERDDVLDQRRDEQSRVRDRPDDHRSSRHRDESWRQRERDDRQRLKQPHEDSLSKRESEEGRGSSRSGRGLEDKLHTVNVRAKDESKGLGSDRDFQLKDKRRLSEQPKKRDRLEDETPSQHRGRDDIHGRDNRSNMDERSSRHERSGSHNDHPVNASDRHWMHKERHKDSRRKSKESEGGDQNTLVPAKRKQEDSSGHRNEKRKLIVGLPSYWIEVM